LAAKANGTAIQTPDPTFSKATLWYYRLELRRFGSICVQLAGQRAILTDITSRRAARLPVERRTTQGAADVSDASHDLPAEFVQAGCLDPWRWTS
jgi:hypothetical protein